MGYSRSTLLTKVAHKTSEAKFLQLLSSVVAEKSMTCNSVRHPSMSDKLVGLIEACSWLTWVIAFRSGSPARLLNLLPVVLQ